MKKELHLFGELILRFTANILQIQHDILVGAVVGSAVGYLIPYLHRADNNASDIYPTLNNTNGLTLHYVFQF